MNFKVKPEVVAFLASVRIFCTVLGTLMAKEGWDHNGFYHAIMFTAGSVMALGCGAYGVYATFRNMWRALAVGTQAGINLAVSGKAVDSHGNVIEKFTDPDSTPPKPVTVETAKEIVKDFAPSAPPKAS